MALMHRVRVRMPSLASHVRQRTDAAPAATHHLRGCRRPSRAAGADLEIMMSKRVRGNKEAKKPKQAPRAAPLPTAELAPPAPTLWPRPRQARK